MSSNIVMTGLNIVSATAFVVTGYVQNKPVIIAVSGEGPRAKIYVIAVLYIRCDPDIGVKVLVSFLFHRKLI